MCVCDTQAQAGLLRCCITGRGDTGGNHLICLHISSSATSIMDVLPVRTVQPGVCEGTHVAVSGGAKMPLVGLGLWKVVPPLDSNPCLGVTLLSHQFVLASMRISVLLTASGANAVYIAAAIMA